ncbi:sialate O-acetylesterase [Christiangramia fulva]|nr:sialate O-acetylesterase [Christiangramia fulva]
MKKLLFLLVCIIPLYGFSNISLPKIFGDNMVLQRNTEVSLWGWAKPGENIKIKLSWNSDNFETMPDNSGFWKIMVPTSDAKGSQTIEIHGYNTVKLENVLLGEVWLVSGQSNMEWSSGAGIDGGEEAIKNAENDQIRFFTVNHRTAGCPQNDLDGQWVSSTPETMKNFSAIGYFFAQKMNEELNVPVGLVNATWGGTPAEPWIPAKMIKKDSILNKAAAMLPDTQWGPNKPGSIYNAMIAPFTSYTLSGILWYQGESNTPNADYYHEIFTTLIKSWRETFGKDLPFYFAQIAPFSYETAYSGVKIRDAQRRALELEKTGMIMTSDIGNTENIHPKNKKEAGYRFARLVLADKFGKKLPAYAPQFSNASLEGKKVIISFNHAGGLYVSNDKKTQFEIAGENRDFQPATFRIKGDNIILNSPVKKPMYIRFSWRNTSTSNIFNNAGLPLSSFSEKLE